MKYIELFDLFRNNHNYFLKTIGDLNVEYNINYNNKKEIFYFRATTNILISRINFDVPNIGSVFMPNPKPEDTISISFKKLFGYGLNPFVITNYIKDDNKKLLYLL